MAEKVELVRGTLYGATVQDTRENLEPLGAQFEPDGKADQKAAKKAPAKKAKK